MTASTRDETEAELVRRLCSGDAAAFETLVSRYHPAMLRLARSFVSTETDAEDVVQDTWLGALRGIERFEGRSTVKTWLFRILVNRAKTHGIREARCRPFSSLDNNDRHGRRSDDSPTDDQLRADAMRRSPASSRGYDTPDLALLAGETRKDISRALDLLPASQRRVVVLRDVSGFSAAEVCAMLDLTEANQRVLLHRGRAKLRALVADLQPAPMIEAASGLDTATASRSRTDAARRDAGLVGSR